MDHLTTHNTDCAFHMQKAQIQDAHATSSLRADHSKRRKLDESPGAMNVTDSKHNPNNDIRPDSEKVRCYRCSKVHPILVHPSVPRHLIFCSHECASTSHSSYSNSNNGINGFPHGTNVFFPSYPTIPPQVSSPLPAWNYVGMGASIDVGYHHHMMRMHAHMAASSMPTSVANIPISMFGDTSIMYDLPTSKLVLLFHRKYGRSNASAPG